jgi:hypothetical protein
MAPPVVDMAAAVKPLGASEKVKVIVAVSPAFRALALLLIERVGMEAKVSKLIGALLPLAPCKRRLPSWRAQRWLPSPSR